MMPNNGLQVTRTQTAAPPHHAVAPDIAKGRSQVNRVVNAKYAHKFTDKQTLSHIETFVGGNKFYIVFIKRLQMERRKFHVYSAEKFFN